MRTSILTAVMIGALFACGCENQRRVQAADSQTDEFLITFGVNDAEPADWSGSAEVEGGGRIVSLVGWRFEKTDHVTGANSWTCATRRAAVLDPKNWWLGAEHTVPQDMTPPQPAMLTNSLWVAAQGAPAIRVKTAQGEFSFRSAGIMYGSKASSLGGRVAIERAPPHQLLTRDDGLEDDQPAISVGSDGVPWLAWTGYRDENETLFAARLGSTDRVKVAGGEFFRPAIAVGSKGRVYLAASVHQNNTWKIAVAENRNGRWSALKNISNGGPDLFPRVAVSAAGRVWVVWQGLRGGRSRILSSSFNGKKWAAETEVSQNTRDAWEPAIDADFKGRVHVAWDAYDSGTYDIYYRELALAGDQPARRITRSGRSQAHAAIACDAQDRVWLTWDDGGANWGKDYGFLVKNAGMPLYKERRVRFAVLEGAKVLEPAALDGFFEQPQLIADRQGNLWMMVRRRTVKLHEVWSQTLQRNRLQQYSLWDYALFRYSGDGWSAPITLPLSDGRNDLRAAMAAGPDGGLVAVWSGDRRSFAQPYPYLKNDIFTARLPALPAISPTLGDFREARAEKPPIAPDEAAQIARIRSARVQANGQTLRIIRGDLHRHSDISFDGDVDGSIWDFYRYTMDAADMDYSALTDHNAGDDHEYFWWIIQKSNDLFYYPGRFTPLYAYERSVRYPNGHRNLLWTKRGVHTLPRTQAEDDGKEGAQKLYEYLHATGGISLPHTSGTMMGTDWRDNDPTLDLLVEIYQGDRMSYEYDGAPRAPKENEPFTQPGGYAPKGYVWNAWAKGFKIGVEASSDHSSTHISYAMLLAENATRESILAAIRARHAYAATDNIVLDVRSGEHIQGDIFPSAGRPKLKVRVQGTSPVDKVEIIRNNQFVYTVRPAKAEVEFEYDDTGALSGESYYYVRVQQSDGNLAWSSPMWITWSKP